MPRKTIEEKSITIAEARKALEKSRKEEDLGEFQRRTLEYTRKFAKLTPEKSDKLADELVKKFQLDRNLAIQIVNCLPKTPEEVRTFFAVKGRTATGEQIEAIAKLVKTY